MKLGPAFPRSFYERPCLDVAPDLLGAWLVRKLSDEKLLVGRIVEVEAYLGIGVDSASHAYRRQTLRNQAMFGPAGRLYVYRSYGMHFCANVVCEEENRAAAVLLRAVEPLLEFRAGILEMCKMRRMNEKAFRTDESDNAFLRQIASGPGKLTQAFKISLDDYGTDLTRGTLTIRQSTDGHRVQIAKSGRIGISTACDLPYRFYDATSSSVSRTKPHANISSIKTPTKKKTKTAKPFA